MTKLKETNYGAATSIPAIKQLILQLESDDGLVRVKARTSLVQRGRQALKALVAAMDSKNTRVRWEAAKALEQLADPAAAPALIKALQDPEFDVRWLATEAIIALGWRAAEPMLRAVIQHADNVTLRDCAHHILNHLALGDRDEHHVRDHPAADESDLKYILSPVVSALEDLDAAVKAPVAAAEAMDALRRGAGREAAGNG